MTGDAARILDEFLVVSARTGDRAAFERLVRRWHPKLLAHAWRLTGDAESARDAVQSAWSEIVRALPRLREERAFAAWAYRIVSRRCARQIGAAVRERTLAEAIAREPPADAAAPAPAGDVARLRSAIRALPPGQRSAIALFHFEGLSVAETAVALNVPAGTVKTRLMHARRKLLAALEGEETCATSTG